MTAGGVVLRRFRGREGLARVIAALMLAGLSVGSVVSQAAAAPGSERWLIIGSSDTVGNDGATCSLQSGDAAMSGWVGQVVRNRTLGGRAGGASPTVYRWNCPSVPIPTDSASELDAGSFDVVIARPSAVEVGLGSVVSACVGARSSWLLSAASWSDPVPVPDCPNGEQFPWMADPLVATSASLEQSLRDAAEFLNADGVMTVLGQPQLFSRPADWDRWRTSRCMGSSADVIVRVRAATQQADRQLRELALAATDDRAVFADLSAVFDDVPGSGHGFCGRGADWVRSDRGAAGDEPALLGPGGSRTSLAAAGDAGIASAILGAWSNA